MNTKCTRRSLIQRSCLAGPAIAALATPAFSWAESPEKNEPEVTATEDLMREHGVIRRALLVYAECVPKLRGNAAALDPSALHRTAQLFRRFGEDYHEKMLEEEHIFPITRKMGTELARYADVLINQHANINRTAKILQDERLVEFIVVQDNFLTPSARFADLVLPALREAARDLVRLRDGRSGRLVMAIECHSCFEWLMPALNRFRQDWPEVELDFTSGFHADAQDLLRRRELDLVVTSNPGPDPSLRFVPLFDYEARLVVGLQHPLASKAFVEPADLADQTLVTYPVDEERLDVFAHFLSPAGVRPAGLRHSELTLMMVQLAASGRGVCALPGWAAQEFEQRGWIRTLPLGAHGTWRTLYAAIREEDADLAFLQDFLLTARTTSEATLSGIRPVRAY